MRPLHRSCVSLTSWCIQQKGSWSSVLHPTQTHSDKDSFSYRAHLGKIHFKTSLDFWIFLLVKNLAFVRSTELWLPRILMGVLPLLPALVWQYTVGSSLFRGRYVGTCRRQLVTAWLDTAGDVFPWCWSPTVFGTPQLSWLPPRRHWEL